MCLCKEAEPDEFVLVWLSSSSDPECVTVEARDQKKKRDKESNGVGLNTERNQTHSEKETTANLNGLSLWNGKTLKHYPDQTGCSCTHVACHDIGFDFFCPTLSQISFTLSGQINVSLKKTMVVIHLLLLLLILFFILDSSGAALPILSSQKTFWKQHI